MKVCFLDVDGVLNFYPQCWIDYINMKLNTEIKTLDEAKNVLSYKTYTDLKRDYRESDYKRNLEVRRGAGAFSQFLKKNGYKIVITTSRPVEEHPGLVDGTIEWLKKNHILFDEFVFDRNKPVAVIMKYPELSFGVEDSRYHANLLGRWGYNIFLIHNKHNRGETAKNVIRVFTFDEIIETVKYVPRMFTFGEVIEAVK